MKAGILIAYGRDAPYQPAAGKFILNQRRWNMRVKAVVGF